MDAAISANRYVTEVWEWPVKAPLKVFKSARFLLGVVGVILALPFLALLLLISDLAINISTRSLRKNKSQIINKLSELEDREKMAEHRSWERLVARIASQLEELADAKSLWVFKGFVTRYEKAHLEMAQIEREIREIVYPDLNRQPTSEDTARLQKAFGHFDDWNDPSLDVYEEYVS